MDVRSETEVSSTLKSIDDPLNLLINNAAIYDPKWPGLAAGSIEGISEALDVNTLGPLRVTKAALPNLKAAKDSVVAMISSGMGSISDRPGGNALGYRTSKAALNMLSQVIGHDLRRQGTSVLMICPGWVATDMGGAGAPLSPRQSATGILARIEEQTLSQTCRFVGHDGSHRSW